MNKVDRMLELYFIQTPNQFSKEFIELKQKCEQSLKLKEITDGGTVCLYVCEVHLLIVMQEVQFGSAINEVLDCSDSKCVYCARKAQVRLFVYKKHHLVDKFLKRNPI